MSLDFR